MENGEQGKLPTKPFGRKQAAQHKRETTAITKRKVPTKRPTGQPTQGQAKTTDKSVGKTR